MKSPVAAPSNGCLKARPAGLGRPQGRPTAPGRDRVDAGRRFGLVYGILVMLGVGTLLPWNVMITEKEFFDVRLHVEPYNPAVAGNFLSIFGLTFNTANLLAFCAVACLHSGRLSLRAQILHPLAVILALLAATACLALRLDLPGTVVAYYSLPTLAALGICMAVLQGGVLNLACLFPPIYIQGFTVGAGLSGVGTSVLSFITQLRATEGPAAGDTVLRERTPAQVAPAAFAYFAAAASVTALCAGAFTLLARLEFSRARLAAHYAAVKRSHHEPDGSVTESLLGAPYEGNVPEEGEGVPGVERYYWPAALLPYLHPATVAAEASMYWEADPAEDAALLEGEGRDEAGQEEGGDGDGGGWDEEEGGGGGEEGEDGEAEGGGVTPLARRPSRGSSRGSFGGRSPASASAPLAVPSRKRSESWGGGGGVPGSAPHAAGAMAGSYESGGLGGGQEGGGQPSSSYRCGTALRFYRSSSANALRGMMEAAAAQAQAQAQTQQLMLQEQGGLTAAFVASTSAQAQWAEGRRMSGVGSGELVPSAAAPAAAAPQGRGRARGGGGGKAGASKRGAAAVAPERSAWPFVFYAVSIVVCMAGSLAVWPGVTAFICGAHNPATVSPCAARGQYGRWDGDLFVPAMFVVFALGDVTGRIASSWGPWGRCPPAAAALMAYALARLGVVAALLFCHVVTPSAWLLPPLLNTDGWTMGLVLGLGLSQGHLLSTACMHAPAVLPPGKEARFGPVTGFCITAGCLGGSIASTLLVEAFTADGGL
ncbi:MAG: hypothetical protein J3K34DRAFT_525488 [Monoraphidium minutum]|nr:MAG: hypothetical protein J3K34DRAFT_525488 [Monoraphidium minutum]